MIGTSCTVLALIFTPLVGMGQSDDKDRKSTLQRCVNEYVSAYNRADIDKLAGFWTENGVYRVLDDSTSINGREAISEGYAKMFDSKKQLRLSLSVSETRFVTNNVAIQHGVARVVSASDAPIETKLTAVWVKKDEKWFLDSVTEESAGTPASHFNELKELSWMIGEWQNRSGDKGVIVRTKCAWTKNKNFITRSFAVEVDGKIDMEGTQIIAWDPAKKTIRSWVFDSDGGFGEGIWRRNGKEWTVHYKAVLPDGKTGSSVNTWLPVDEDTHRWRSFRREVDGEFLPSVDITIVRVKE